jgi:hypothetical protein
MIRNRQAFLPRGWLAVMSMIFIVSLQAGHAQTLDGGSGYPLSREAEVLAPGRFILHSGFRYFSGESGSIGVPVSLIGGLGLSSEFSLMIPLMDSGPDNPRMLGDYAAFGVQSRIFGEERSSFRVALNTTIQQELESGGRGETGGTVFCAGPVLTVRPYGSWQWHLNGFYCSSDSRQTPSHTMISSAISTHITESVEGLLDIWVAEEGYNSSGTEVQVVAGARALFNDKFQLTMSAGYGASNGNASPLVLVSLALFTERPVHSDYRGFVSRIKPMPLEKVDQLLKESISSSDPVVPPEKTIKRFSPVAQFASGSFTPEDSLYLKPWLDYIHAAAGEAGFLLVGTSDHVSHQGDGLIRAAGLLAVLMDSLNDGYAASLAAMELPVGSDNAPPPGTVELREWRWLRRELVAAERRGRSITLSGDQCDQIPIAMKQVGKPGPNEVMILQGIHEDNDQHQALGEAALHTAELIMTGEVAAEKLAVGVANQPAASGWRNPLFLEWRLNWWNANSDSLYADLLLVDTSDAPEKESRVVGLLKSGTGWMSSSGVLIKSLSEETLTRKSLSLPIAGSSIRIGWRLMGSQPSHPIIRIACKESGIVRFSVPVPGSIREDLKERLSRVALDAGETPHITLKVVKQP